MGTNRDAFPPNVASSNRTGPSCWHLRCHDVGETVRTVLAVFLVELWVGSIVSRDDGV